MAANVSGIAEGGLKQKAGDLAVSVLPLLEIPC
jgi:hypothetical protein